MRRRRLDAYRRTPDWPGKDPSWRWELSRYDEFLLRAASMLDVAVPQHDKVPLATGSAGPRRGLSVYTWMCRSAYDLKCRPTYDLTCSSTPAGSTN